MTSLFFNCSQLKTIPDISNWNIENVTNISFMFKKCTSLKYLPDISKWNTKNIIDMKFYN